MAVPKQITVTGKFTKTSGAPESGTISFYVPGFLRSSGLDETITPGSFTVKLDSNGECSFSVFATDDVNWTPQGWTYRVLVNLSSYRGVSYSQIPSNAPGDTIDMADLLPVLEQGGESYAPIAHTHDSYVTEAELQSALDDFEGGSSAVLSVNGEVGIVVLDAGDVGASPASHDHDTRYFTETEVTNALSGKVAKTGDDMTGDLVVRAGDNSKGYRLRASGGALDLEFGGAELWLAGKSGSPGDPFGGTQYRILILRSDGGGVTAEGLWDFTGTVTGIDKNDVGLGNLDNTSDANKPISSATLTALSSKADASAVSTALGAKADLVGGKIVSSQLSSLSISQPFPVANQAAMLALTAERGDIAIRADNGKTFVLSTDNPGTLADWIEMPATGVITSVNGQTGIVILGKTDIGLGNVDNTSDMAKPVSTLQQAAIDLMVDPTELAAALTSYATTSALTSGLAGVSFTANAAYTESQKALQSNWLASDHGLAAWSYDPAASQGGTVLPTAGLVFSVRMRILGVTQINNILMHLTAGGTSLTAGQCFAAVFNDAGTTLIASTADQATNWATGGPKTMPLVGAPIAASPYTWVRVVFWFNGTTGPTVTRGSNINAAAANLGMASGYRFATSNAGTTTSLTSIGTLTASQAAWLVGIN